MLFLYAIRKFIFSFSGYSTIKNGQIEKAGTALAGMRNKYGI